MLITGQTRLKVYNAFVQPVCVIVAMCGISAHSKDKLEQLNKQIIKFIQQL